MANTSASQHITNISSRVAINRLQSAVSALNGARWAVEMALNSPMDFDAVLGLLAPLIQTVGVSVEQAYEALDGSRIGFFIKDALDETSDE